MILGVPLRAFGRATGMDIEILGFDQKQRPRQNDALEKGTYGTRLGFLDCARKTAPTLREILDAPACSSAVLALCAIAARPPVANAQRCVSQLILGGASAERGQRY